LASSWISYNDLAWTEKLLVNPSDYEKEVSVYLDLIKHSAKKAANTLLHLGCGAGGHDAIFKRSFKVTGVDLSLGMLNIARETHPDIEYLEGDMRSLRLNRQFDVVVIPDSIDYMNSPDDLQRAIQTATLHLKADGKLLIVAKTKETFQNNNFAYSGEKGDVHVTLFENNFVNPLKPDTYEATLVYLIREKGELSIHTEHQILGLFPLASWESLFKDSNLAMRKVNLDGIYEPFILGEGEYPMTIFVGQKTK
jgi:SAM-dependent methyltransferase